MLKSSKTSIEYYEIMSLVADEKTIVLTMKQPNRKPQ